MATRIADTPILNESETRNLLLHSFRVRTDEEKESYNAEMEKWRKAYEFMKSISDGNF
ncbi:MAG: hypothetical protein IK025_03345 [Bacteroidales bacterium]|nr:hypothetical protein [Bacteroidales bacterium]